MFEGKFKLGETYKTKSGRDVKIIEEVGVGTRGHCVKGDDGLWRYAYANPEPGRVCASPFDMSDPRNLVPTE